MEKTVNKRRSNLLTIGAAIALALAIIPTSVTASSTAGGGGYNFDYPPIFFSMYTLDNGTLNLSAQMAPVGVDTSKQVRLQIKRNGSWENIGNSGIDRDAKVADFKIEDWEYSNENVPYRVVYHMEGYEGDIYGDYYWDGTIRKVPEDEIKIAAFTGHSDHHALKFPWDPVVSKVEKQDPDFLFFSGDEMYEGNHGYGPSGDVFGIGQLRRWCEWGWAWRDVIKNRPTVAIPDDHDVHQGNLWGENGKDAGSSCINGGYVKPPYWVNMTQRAYISNLPGPYDPRPVEQGIGVYYTSIDYGGISFAVLEDRKFKTTPKNRVPENLVDGWDHVTAPGYDPERVDVDNAVLLGDRQLDFLEAWGEN